jgi:signal transduction histidine kinase
VGDATSVAADRVPEAEGLTRKLEALAETTRRVWRGGPHPTGGHLPWVGRAQPHRQAFNMMAERIAELRQRERELLANVSHELRTPMARMAVLFYEPRFIFLRAVEMTSSSATMISAASVLRGPSCLPRGTRDLGGEITRPRRGAARGAGAPARSGRRRGARPPSVRRSRAGDPGSSWRARRGLARPPCTSARDRTAPR